MKKTLCTFFMLVWLSGMLSYVMGADSSKIKYKVLSSTTCEVDASQPYISDGAVEIPEKYENRYTVIGIAKGAFSKTNITSVKLPATITYINESAFSDCGKLKEINLPSGLESIGNYVFKNTALETIEFPEGLTKIGLDVFKGCQTLKNVYYNSINANPYVSWSAPARDSSSRREGDLFMRYNLFPTSVEMVTFGPKVRNIPRRAFIGCDKITELVLPDSVKNIGGEAFSGCTGLTKVKMGPNVKNVYDKAFSNCSGVTDWELSTGFETIGEEAFVNCVGIKKVVFPENFQSVGKGAFVGCSAIEEIYCNTSQELGGEYGMLQVPVVFEDSLCLKKLEYGPAGFGCYKLLSKVKSVDEVVFNTIYQKVTSPSTYQEIDLYVVAPVAKKVVIGEDVQTIPSHFMPGNKYVTELKLPGSLLSIGTFAFRESALTTVELPENCAYIDKYAFAECDSLSQATWSGNGIRVEAYAFKGCPIKELHDLDKLSSLGEFAFRDNLALESVTIPYGLWLNDGCFFGCENLKTLYLDGIRGFSYRDFELGRYFPSVLEKIVMGPQNKKVWPKMFKDLPNLKSVLLNSAINEVDSDAFNGCAALEQIDIPEGVRKLGKRAFKGCTSLSEIKLPVGITEIPKECFADCSSLKLAVLPDDLSTIGELAFSHCGLKEIKFGNTPVEIGANAFYAYTNENNVDKIEFGNLDAFIYSRYANAFASPLSWDHPGKLFVNGKEITEVVVPEKMTSICAGKFMGLTDVDVKLPKHIKSVGERAFYHSGIRYFESDALSYLGKEAFSGSRLKEFRATGSISKINYGTFWSMEDLEVLILPDDIDNIDEYGVASLPNLKKLRVPAKLNSLAWNGISTSTECAMDVYYGAPTPQEFKQCSFGQAAYEGTLYVPASALKTVSTVSPWKGFKNIVAYDFEGESGIEAVPAEESDDEITAIYSTSGIDMGRSLEALPAGIYFVKRGNAIEKIVKRP